MFNESARFYSQHRRSRDRQMSYQAYLAGEGEFDQGGGVLAAAESQRTSAGKSIMIGVATGALIFLVNKWLERLIK
jgi:hypothetical protein